MAIPGIQPLAGAVQTHVVAAPLFLTPLVRRAMRAMKWHGNARGLMTSFVPVLIQMQENISPTTMKMGLVIPIKKDS